MEAFLADPSPLCGRRCDADHHDRGISEDLLQVLVVLALIQIVPKFLHRTEQRRWNFITWTGNTFESETLDYFPLHIDQAH